jgi:hypothetical protein
MKKLLLTGVVSVMILISADAQIFNIGIKGGLGFSKISFDNIYGIDDGGDVYDLVTGESVMGYHIGLQTRIKLAMVYVQPEIYWNAGGGTVEKIADDPSLDAIYDVRFSRIDIPVLAGVKLGPLRINAGPVGTITVSSDSNGLEELHESFESLGTTMGFGFQAGIGLGLSKISLDARYEGSLTKYLGDEVTIGGNPYTLDARPSQWILSLGFWFN